MVGLVANLGKFHLSLPARRLPKRCFRKYPITIITTVATIIIKIRVVSSIFSPVNNSKHTRFKPYEKKKLWFACVLAYVLLSFVVCGLIANPPN